MSTILVHDCTHANLPKLPNGWTAGYTTGSADIKWTASDWAGHPVAVRICQDSGATDETADVLDVEAGAAVPAEVARWATNSLRNYQRATRKGQRIPAVYMSASNVHTVEDALIKGGIQSGIGLFVANWNLSDAQAETIVASASGPFPTIGVQFENNGTFDSSVMSQEWHNTVSDKPYYSKDGWLNLTGAPAGVRVYFNSAKGTLGYHDDNGVWKKVLLP